MALTARLAEVGRFGLVGIIANLVHFACQWFWHEVVGLPVLAAFWCAFAVAFAISFVLHHRITFRSSRSYAAAALRFLAVQVAMQGVNFALFALLCRWCAHLPHGHLVALAVSTAAVQVVVYLSARRIFITGPAGQEG